MAGRAEADVVVVGAGLAGLTAARELQRAGPACPVTANPAPPRLAGLKTLASAKFHHVTGWPAG